MSCKHRETVWEHLWSDLQQRRDCADENASVRFDFFLTNIRNMYFFYFSGYSGPKVCEDDDGSIYCPGIIPGVSLIYFFYNS